MNFFFIPLTVALDSIIHPHTPNAFPFGEGGPRQRWMRAFHTVPMLGKLRLFAPLRNSRLSKKTGCENFCFHSLFVFCYLPHTII